MSNNSLSLLLVEDNPGDARLIQSLLEEAVPGAFHLNATDRLSTAFERLAAGGIQVILLALSLPDSHGLDTFSRVHLQAPEAPILILTGHDDLALSLVAIREGAQDYLIKGQITQPALTRAVHYAIERNQLMLDLRATSLTDPLTGLYNRRAFLALAEKQLLIARRAQRQPLALFVDVDDFKHINDTFGHRVGDQALQAVAEVLRETFRQSDIIGRFGGDEFVVLAVEIAEEGVEALLARLRQNLLAHPMPAKNSVQLSLSIGLARYDPARPIPIDELLAQADARMYNQKRDNHLLEYHAEVASLQPEAALLVRTDRQPYD